jgi:hypothetical protein
VPLVAATMGMYDLSQVPQDDQLWQLIALCAGMCQQRDLCSEACMMVPQLILLYIRVQWVCCSMQCNALGVDLRLPHHTACALLTIRSQIGQILTAQACLSACLCCFQEPEARSWSLDLLLALHTWVWRAWVLGGTCAKSPHGCWLGMLLP